MYKQLLPILVTIVLILCGCSVSVETGTEGAARVARIDTCEGMISYLQKKNLPALKSVEIWRNEYGPGLKLTTKHYEILTTLLEPLMLSQVPGFVESAYRAYNDQLPQPIETTKKFRIYLFSERKQWEDFTRSFAGPHATIYLKIKAGAYYLKDSCVAYNIGRERTFSVLGHEGWHQFNKRRFKFRLPSWLDEGVAMLFEVSEEREGLFYFDAGRNFYRLGALKKTLAGRRMIPLRDLVAINPGEVLAIDSDTAVAAFYGQSYALVRFLREEGYGKRLTNYHRMMLGGLEGNWPISAENQKIAVDRNIPLTVRWNRSVGTKLFEEYISEDFGQIEKEYIAFCRKIVYHVR
jgi:hypothetical protein